MGASSNCVAIALASLKEAVSLSFTVRRTDRSELVGSKWRTSCQLLVMPGGRDAPYCKELDGRGNKEIRAFVEGEGSYLGICAGAYYGSAYVEFCKGDPVMEVVGPRELAFFPVTLVGPAIPGYRYASDVNAHVVEMRGTKTGEQVLGMEGAGVSSVFYNGGCYFQERSKPDGRHCETKPLYDTIATFSGH